MIPKRLHFTWKTAELPPALQRCYNSFVRTHPDWEIILWTDASMRALVAGQFPELLATLTAMGTISSAPISSAIYDPVAQAGVRRSTIWRAFGPTDEFLQFDCFVGVEPFEHVGDHRREAGVRYLLSNAFMGSVPGHPLWSSMCSISRSRWRPGPTIVLSYHRSLDAAGSGAARAGRGSPGGADCRTLVAEHRWRGQGADIQGRHRAARAAVPYLSRQGRSDRFAQVAVNLDQLDVQAHAHHRALPPDTPQVVVAAAAPPRARICADAADASGL